MQTKITDRATLLLGQRVHCILYGGRDGTIVTIHGEQRPDTVQNVGPCIAGGSARFDVVWDDGSQSRQLPESLLYSVQWYIYDEVLPSAAVMRLRRLAVETAERRAQEKEEAERQFEADKARLIAENAHLVPGDTVEKNIRRALKQAFPGVKFSVRKRHHGSTDISWEDDAVDPRRVHEVVDRFKAGNFDGMTDCYSYSRSPWTAAFGSHEYIFCTSPDGCLR